MQAVARSIAAAAALLFLLGNGSSAAARKPVTHRLTIEGTVFPHELLTIKVGDSVTWTNKDPFPHTVTSTTGAFDSKVIAPDATWTYKATKKGEFPYSCTLHPTMKGRLKVE